MAIMEGSEESRRKKQKHSKEKKTDTRKSLTSAQKAEICHLKQKDIKSGDPPEEITIKDAIDFTASAWKK
ncbi:13928_t:CDS:2, partial [Cetraspora pellucida]